MKKIQFFTVVAFFLASSFALGGDQNIAGVWEVNITEIRSDGTPGEERNLIKIIQATGENLLYGYVCNLPDEPGREFSGLVDGKDVYITHWDSITKGQMEKKATKIEGINQAFYYDERSSKTAIFTGTYLGETDECCNDTEDGLETDIDCGGPVCAKCGNEMKCLTNDDCQSGNCDISTLICMD